MFFVVVIVCFLSMSLFVRIVLGVEEANLGFFMIRTGFPGGSVVKNQPASAGTWVRSLRQEDPLEKGMATHSSILAWESHGQRSLVGYSPWGHKSQTQRSN